MISLVRIDLENLPYYQDQILGIEKRSFTAPWGLHAFEEEVNRPGSHLWALLEDGVLVGYICFWVTAAEVHLMNIAVHPGKRRRGLARQLLQRMIDVGLSQRSRAVFLEVRPSNNAAKSLYGELGFREVDCRQNYYRDTREDAIVMSRVL